MRRLVVGLALAALLSAIALVTIPSGFADEGFSKADFCTSPGSSFRCLDVANVGSITASNGEYPYVGHDEPSLLFYSNTPGSGYDQFWQMTLPKQPAALPNQTATSSFWDFQLHPAFWFGVAMCDSQSFPEYTKNCPAHNDGNIFDDPSGSSPKYIGHHPGTAFMEMQFYPPGWVAWPGGDSCSATQWCAALNIDSLSISGSTGAPGACTGLTGVEPVNFAFITKNGVPHAPANPLDATLATYTPNPSTDLFMNSGDKLRIRQFDTFHGLQISILDVTTGQKGWMTASSKNTFGQVPFSGACNNIPYDFHPMYATSNEHTRVPWAAHSYNVAFSDEIGHWDYCTGATLATSLFGVTCPAGNTEGAAQGTPEAGDPGGTGDNNVCWPASQSTNAPVQGCLGTNDGFDGTAYADQAWPGTGNDANTPAPIMFKSPYINGNPNLQFDRVGFEADLPRIEVTTPDNPNNTCDRNTGVACVNPPYTDDQVGGLPNETAFYPIFTTGQSAPGCIWRLGGPNLPGTTNTFGGTSTTEYGPLLQSHYQSGVSGVTFRYNNFRKIIANPC